MEEEFVTYKRFSTVEDAEVFVGILKNNAIRFELENNSICEDVSAVYGAVPQTEIDVKLIQSDFEKVDKLLEKEAAETILLLDKEYYLYDFTNEELYDVINNYDKWNETDYLLAQKILNARGEKITDEVTKSKKDKRLKELNDPEPAMQGWMTIGYVSAVLGGILGMFIGYHHWQFKKRVPSGDRVFAYDEDSREKGRLLFYVGLGFFVVWGLVYLFLI